MIVSIELPVRIEVVAVQVKTTLKVRDVDHFLGRL